MTRVPGYHPRRVAPFGDLGIAGCQRLPRAFRRVAASFLGRRRQGIHRAPIIAEAPRAPRPAPAAARRRAAPSPRPSPAAGGIVRLSPSRPDPAGPAGAAAGQGPGRAVRLSRCLRWSRGESNPGPPPCKGGALPAKLRPPESLPPAAAAIRGGRAWTRTRDLGLIRAAL